MSLETVKENFDQTHNAISKCIENHWITPALVLIYSGIDAAASLNRKKGKAHPTPDDFRVWVNQYLLRSANFDCTAEEFLSARHGIVHTFSPTSKKSSHGKVRTVIYTFGNRDPRWPNTLMKELGYNQAVAIRVEELAAAFRTGVNTFIADMESNSEQRQLVEQRARKLFRRQSSFP